jgi:hypothetical protein
MNDDDDEQREKRMSVHGERELRIAKSLNSIVEREFYHHLFFRNR